MKDKNTTIPFGADEIMYSFLKSNGAPLTDSELKRIKHTESLKDLMALGYIRHEHSNVFLTLQGRMALRQFDEEHKSESNKESANVFSIIISVLAILVSMLNTVAGLVKNDATVNYASINLFTNMLSALEVLLIGFFVSKIILPSVKYFRFHPVARVLFGTMAAVLLYFIVQRLDSRWYPIHPKLRKAFTDLSTWYIAFSGRVQPLVDPVDPQKANVPVEVGLQFLRKHTREAPWEVSLPRAESCCPRAAAILEEAEPDALAYLDFPPTHWKRLRTNNVKERTNREIKRRSRVVQVFPSTGSLVRLAGAVMCEQDEIWQKSRYFSEAKMRELYDEGRTRGIDGTVDWERLEAEARKMIESGLELADRIEAA